MFLEPQEVYAGAVITGHDAMRIGEGAAGVDKQFGANDSLSARLYGDVTAYNQTFSSVSLDRNSETLTAVQHVPEQARPPQETPDPDDDPTREWREWSSKRRKQGE